MEIFKTCCHVFAVEPSDQTSPTSEVPSRLICPALFFKSTGTFFEKKSASDSCHSVYLLVPFSFHKPEAVCIFYRFVAEEAMPSRTDSAGTSGRLLVSKPSTRTSLNTPTELPARAEVTPVRTGSSLRGDSGGVGLAFGRQTQVEARKADVGDMTPEPWTKHNDGENL